MAPGTSLLRRASRAISNNLEASGAGEAERSTDAPEAAPAALGAGGGAVTTPAPSLGAACGPSDTSSLSPAIRRVAGSPGRGETSTTPRVTTTRTKPGG